VVLFEATMRIPFAVAIDLNESNATFNEPSC
jgi:hypothetical protein